MDSNIISGHMFSISCQSSCTMLWSICPKVMEYFFMWTYVVWDFYRTCPTRIVIGMKPASIASSARTPWWTNLLLRRKNTFFVPNVTQMNTLPSVASAKRPSCQVRSCPLWRHNRAFVKYFLKPEKVLLQDALSRLLFAFQWSGRNVFFSQHRTFFMQGSQAEMRGWEGAALDVF